MTANKNIHENSKSITALSASEKTRCEFSLKTVKAESAQRLSAPIPGFVDYTPQEQYLFTHWLKLVSQTYEQHGFTPVHIRPLERLKVLLGETENQKQIFGVYRADGNFDTTLGIPFDHTVPLSLYVAEHAEHHKHLPLPYKRYDISNAFRGERPQAGRFRAFVQADIDIIGKKLGIAADAECLATLVNTLQSLELGSFQINLNHIDIVKGIITSARIASSLHPEVLRSIDKLDKLSPQEVAKEILKIEGITLTKEEVLSLIEAFSVPSCSFQDLSLKKDYGEKATKGLNDLKKIANLLEIMSIDPNYFVFTPRMVRGLDYYTGTVFETFLTGKEDMGSIASGGRYSNLVGSFSESPSDIEGVGVSIGLTRLFSIIDKSTALKRSSSSEVLVGFRTEEQRPTAFKVAAYLRKAGFLIDVYCGESNKKGSFVKNLLTHGNNTGIPFTVIAMEDNALVVKDMLAEKDRSKEREPDLTSPEEVLDKLTSLRK